MPIKIHILFIFFLNIMYVQGQRLLDHSQMNLVLYDGQKVTLYAAPTADSVKPYYYLPFNLRISVKNQTPEYSFVTYKENEKSQIISGGIMHFLLTWGATESQSREIEARLKEKEGPLARLMGAAQVETHPDVSTLEFISKHPVAQIFRATQNGGGEIANYSGGKTAFSFQFNQNQVEEILKGLKSPAILKEIQIGATLHYRISITTQGLSTTRTGNWPIHNTLYELLKPIKK